MTWVNPKGVFIYKNIYFMNIFDVLNLKQASELVGITPPALLGHIHRKHLPAKKFADIWTLKNSDVGNFINARKNGKFCKAGRPKQEVFETYIGTKKLNVKKS
jgi:hypothetical protein